MNVVIWTAVGFVLGSLPLSLWLGHFVLHTDIRTYGDGNPGAANVWRAGGWKIGLTAVLLDSLKGAVPVSLANVVFNVSEWGLVIVALAPILGNVFSPFLGFRGGKAIAVTFGVWTGLTLWIGPTVLGILTASFYVLQKSDTWAVILGMLVLGVIVTIVTFNEVTTIIWASNMLIIIWTHRHNLHPFPVLRPWIMNSIRRL
jgi:glycerol-3-phosphate acyltransferase PlsY